MPGKKEKEGVLVELRELRYYIAVYDWKNITSAASALSISQQALSKVISKLEAEFGTPLFERTRSGLLPTEFGSILYAEAGKILLQYSKSHNVLMSACGGTKDLRIGYTEEIYKTLCLSDVISALFVDSPQLRVVTETNTCSVCEQKLLAGELDVAFVEGPLPAGGFRFRLLRQEPFYAAVGADHPLSGREEILLEDLRGCQLIVAGNTSRGANRFLELLEEREIGHQLLYRGVDIDLQSTYILQRQGVAVIPKHVLADYKDRPGIRCVPIGDMPERKLYAIWRAAGETPWLGVFVAHLHKQFSDLSPKGERS